MINQVYVYILLYSTLVMVARASNILMVWPFPVQSHFNLGNSLATSLANKGHKVTFLSPFPRMTPHQNIKEILVKDPIPYIEELTTDFLNIDKKDSSTRFYAAFKTGKEVTRLFLESKEVQRLLKIRPHFDVIILEIFFNEALIGFGHYFKAPIILVSPFNAAIHGHLLGNPSPASYIPAKITELTTDMTFCQRIYNFIASNIVFTFNYFTILRNQKSLFEKYISKKVEFEDVLYNASLLLTNSHPSMGIPQALVPSIIDVGGYHISKPKQVSPDFKRFLDDAKDGIILFSMGSNLKSDDFDDEIKQAIVGAFAQLKQKVIWKLEREIDSIPPNVKTMRWVPQQEILDHPNTKLFISHGGLLSTMEAINFGVPMIGIPIYGDQINNVATAVSQGYALKMSSKHITKQSLYEMIKEIINNPKYRKNAKLHSKFWHDRQQPPMETAIYWIEHVIRHQGAPQLRSPALKYSWYELYMVDFYILCVFLLVIILVLFKTLCNYLIDINSYEKTTENEDKRDELKSQETSQSEKVFPVKKPTVKPPKKSRSPVRRRSSNYKKRK